MPPKPRPSLPDLAKWLRKATKAGETAKDTRLAKVIWLRKRQATRHRARDRLK
jgi:hypothetical protein